jgi:hypothetical protein
MEVMRAVIALYIGVLFACGDNIHPASGTNSIDASQQDGHAVDSLSDICTDTVTEIQPNNPGSAATAYPATGWWSDDTRANGKVTVDAVLGAPSAFGCTAAHFVTGDMTSSPSQDKAQLNSFALTGTPLSTITTVSYWAYRSSLSTGGAPIDLSLNVAITGPAMPYTTLVYEPYNQSGGTAAIMNDVWQAWNATATTTGDGVWWTNKIANPNPGSQANPQPWAAFQALYPNALVFSYGFNIGSNNPDMIVGGDGLVFGATTTDF